VAPAINGDLDDEAWANGDWEGDFTQNEPYEGRKPSQPTEFKIRFDDLNMYIAIKAYDSSPDSITNRMSRRDNGDGDMVFVVLDSYHDLRTGFIFGVSSAGVRFDMIMANDGQSEDPSWDPIWMAKSKIHDWGWAAEMKIPFTQLRFEKKSAEVWGLEVARQIFRHNEMSFWQHIPRTASGFIHCIGEMNGLNEVEPRKQLDLLPYAQGSIETSEADPGNPFETGRKFGFNAGLDAKIGVTNNLTLDLTVNPDFGQVEADPSEVNLSAYESFFQEKRPFFIEGSNITSFNVGLGDGDVGNDNLFYSRRIGRKPHGYPDLDSGEYADIPGYVNILGAAKLTGKTENGLSIGIIESVTSEMNAEIDSSGERSDVMIEPLTSYTVARVQKDFDQGNTIIGGMATGTIRKLDGTGMDYLHSDAVTAGLDFSQYFKDKNYRLSTSLYMSNVRGSEEAIARTQRSSARYFQRPDADYVEYDDTRTSLSGQGGKLEFGKLGGKWNFLFMNTWKSPGLETNDLGYMREADVILNVLWTGYNFTEPFSIFRNLNLNNDIYTVFDFGGNLNGMGYEANAGANFKNFWSFGTGGGYNFNQLSNSILRGGPSMAMPNSWRLWYRVSTDDRKKVSLNFFGNLSRGSENNSSNNGYSLSLVVRPANTLSISLSPSFSNSMNELQYFSGMELNDEDSYIFATLNQKIISMSLRVNYNITPDLTIQYWGQPFSGDIKFSEYKIITDHTADQYNDRFHIYDESEISSTDGTYYVDNGEYSFSFDNPDFKINEWLSNLVIRWEFMPGSTAYLVWSQTRDYYGGPGNYDLADNIDNLFSSKKANNVFMLKFSYRIGLR
ncbi:MAG: hydrolase, partial [Bacteroidia bacterium]